jgi:hypothetical protein
MNFGPVVSGNTYRLYVLTAYHVYEEILADGIGLHGVELVFNYEHPMCDSPGQAEPAKLRVKPSMVTLGSFNDTMDWCLLVCTGNTDENGLIRSWGPDGGNSGPPVTLCLADWAERPFGDDDCSIARTRLVTGIHHPRGDVKKIYQANVRDEEPWTNPDFFWVDTAPLLQTGSSGSPAFNVYGQVAGILTNGGNNEFDCESVQENFYRGFHKVFQGLLGNELPEDANRCVYLSACIEGTNSVNPPPGINYILLGEITQLGCQQSNYYAHVMLRSMGASGNYTLKVYSNYNSQQWTQSGTFEPGSNMLYHHYLPILVTPPYPPGTHVNFLVELRAGGANGPVVDTYVFSHTFYPQTDAGPLFREACVGQAIQLGGPMSSLSQRHWEITSPANAQATLIPAGDDMPTFTAYANGDYTVRLTTSQNGACVETREVMIRVSPCACGLQDPPQVVARYHPCIEVGTYYNLEVQVAGGAPPYRYRWEPTTGIFTASGSFDEPRVWFEGDADPAQTSLPSEYRVVVTDANNCVSTVGLPVFLLQPNDLTHVNACGNYSNTHHLFALTIHSGSPYCPQSTTVPSGANVEWVAESEINLGPGFTAAAGSNFTARLMSCPPFPAGKRSLSNTPLAAPETNASRDDDFSPFKERPTPGFVPRPFVGSALPESMEIAVYPNPFTNGFSVMVHLPRPTTVTADLYDMLGKKVATLFTRRLFDAGVSSWSWDGSGLSDGVYVVSVSAGPTTQTLKLIKAGK